MISIYEKSMFDDISQTIKEYQCDYNISLEDFESVKNLSERMSEGKVTYPIIALSSVYEYVIDREIAGYKTIDSNSEEHTYEFNLKESLPATIYPSLTLLTTDISQIIELEDFILSKYSDAHNLTVNFPDKPNEKIPFQLIVDASKEIARDSGDYQHIEGGKLYQSILKFKCENCVLFSQTYHPARVAFDKEMQKEILQRAVALSAIIKDLNYQQRTLLRARQHEEATTDDEIAFENHIKSISKVRNEFCSSTNIVPSKWMVFRSLNAIYKYMLETDCDVKAATKRYEDLVYGEVSTQQEHEVGSSHDNFDSDSKGSGAGFFGSVLKTAVGVAIGSTGSRREERKQTQLMREQAEREKERDRKADLERWRNKSFSNSCGHNGNNCFNCQRRYTCTHPSKH